jgi:hypothetical protein
MPESGEADVGNFQHRLVFKRGGLVSPAMIANDVERLKIAPFAGQHQRDDRPEMLVVFWIAVDD